MSQWTINRKIAGGRVEVELLTYRPALTTFVVDRLENAHDDISDLTAMYALAVPATLSLTVSDDGRDDPILSRLADYWDSRSPNPVEDLQRFLLLVEESIIVEWYSAHYDVAQTFLADEPEDVDDPEAESVASPD